MNFSIFCAKVIFVGFRFFDKLFLVSLLSYNKYEKLHAFWGYPLIRLYTYVHLGYWPNLRNPSTFNEKLLHDRLFHKNELIQIISDKYAVRDYVAKCIGEEYLIPLLATYDSCNELKEADLPSDCAIKMNHSSGQIVIRKNSSDISKRYPEIVNWFKDKYRYQELMWFNQKIERKLVAEELLLDEKGQVPKDYKFFVFGDEVEFVQVDLDRFNGHSRMLYSPDWKPMDVSYAYPVGYESESPECLDEMLDLAIKLGADFSFMRVDLYEVDGKIYFGELTPYPLAGWGRLEPYSYDVHLGKLVKNNI